jgi:hypothetical protein
MVRITFAHKFSSLEVILKWLHHHHYYSLELTILSSHESDTLGDPLFEVNPAKAVRLEASVPVSQHQPAQVPAPTGLFFKRLETRAPWSSARDTGRHPGEPAPGGV